MGESDKEIVNEMRAPARAGKVAAFVARNLHLWEEKAATAEIFLLLAFGRSAAIDAPIPKGENYDIGEPEQGCG